MERQGEARQVTVQYGSLGLEGHGKAWPSMARLGSAGQSRIVPEGCGAVRQGPARRGKAGFGRQGLAWQG